MYDIYMHVHIVNPSPSMPILCSWNFHRKEMCVGELLRPAYGHYLWLR